MQFKVAVKLVSAIMGLVLLSGCAGKIMHPIAMDQNYLQSADKKVGVAVDGVPAADITYPGADCLLCLGAAAAMNSSLSNHTDSLTTSDLQALEQELANLIAQSGNSAEALAQPVVVKNLPDFDSEHPNAAEKDFSGLGANLGITHLLVVDFDYVGFQRHYASYVPTSDPFAKIVGRAYMVNTQTNMFEWYLPLNLTQFAEGEWDEPDLKFPGLTNAFFQNVERAKESVSAPIRAQLETAEQ